MGNRAEINRHALVDRKSFETCEEGPLDALRRLIDEARIVLPEELPPMAAGLVGYMAYDTVRLMERLPEPNPDAIGIPDGIFVRPTIMAIFDSVKDIITFVTPVRPTLGVDAQQAYRSAIDTLFEATSGLEKSLHHAHGPRGPDLGLPEPSSNMSREAYCEMVEKARAYIAAGDIFQTVLVPALQPALHASTVRTLSGIAPHQPLPVHVFPSTGQVLDRRLESGNPGEVARRYRDGSALSPGRAPEVPTARKTRRSPRTCCRTPRNSRST